MSKDAFKISALLNTRLRALSATILVLALLPNAPAMANEVSGRVPGKLKAKVDAKPVNPEEQPSFIKWKAGVNTIDWRNENEQATAAGVRLDLGIQKSFTEDFKFKSGVYASMRTGYALSRYGEIKPGKGVAFSDAYLEYKPIQQITLQGGVLDQGNQNLPTLLDSNPFPATSEAIKIGNEYYGELSAEQAMPTNASLDPKNSGGEPTPALLIEKLKFAAEPKSPLVTANVFGGIWQFQNLTSAMAADSDILGNTIIKNANGKTQYKYQFEGWLAGAETTVFFSKKVNLNLGGQVIQNTQAPESYRNSQLLSSTLTVKLPKDLDLVPSFAAFFAESDSGPGNFNMTEFGHNNRSGYAASVSLASKLLGYKATAFYSDADVINQTVLQTRQQFIYLSFETLYAFL